MKLYVEHITENLYKHPCPMDDKLEWRKAILELMEYNVLIYSHNNGRGGYLLLEKNKQTKQNKRKF